MGIKERLITSMVPDSGRVRARFKFKFDDGREIDRGPISYATQADAELALPEIENSVLKSAQLDDSFKVVSKNIKSAHGEASSNQVSFAWLKTGFNDTEHYNAYLKIKDIASQLLPLNLTDEQYAAMLNSTVEDATKTRLYWEFLEANKAAIEAYITLAGAHK